MCGQLEWFYTWHFLDNFPSMIAIQLAWRCSFARKNKNLPTGQFVPKTIQPIRSLMLPKVVLKQLLTKAREDRPDATTALGLEWLAAARKSYRSKSFGGSKHLGPTLAGIQLVASWDQVIPPTLRAKAGRAALPPQIAAAAEERRTQALEAVKMRSNLANLGKVRKARPSAIESWSVDNPLEVGHRNGVERCWWLAHFARCDYKCLQRLWGGVASSNVHAMQLWTPSMINASQNWTSWKKQSLSEPLHV